MRLTRNFVKKFATLLGCLALMALTAGQARAAGPGYAQNNLVSDIPGLAAFTDPTLLNPWGIAFFPGASPFWVNDNNAGLSALYFGNGVAFPGLPNVTIPAPTSPTGGTPTGIVANFFAGLGAFMIPDPMDTSFGPALFIFSTEDGTIEAWNAAAFVFPFPGIPNPLTAVIVVDNSAGGGPTGAVYKGLALGNTMAGTPLLYATNFRTGNIDVFDTNFAPHTVVGPFTDPNVQHGYAPFGIQNINGHLWVTYAMQDKARHDPVNKPAHGFVGVFDTDGNLLNHFAQHGHLSSPWGVALAPASFGQFANDILIGNFGDGRINAYDPASRNWLGMVSDSSGKPLVNDGLWSLTFSGAAGMTAVGAPPDTLYFSAGLNHEADGLFGTISPN
jgi:uncharacterized protein (TIGR03118 family)